jgi:hypothetical protein
VESLGQHGSLSLSNVDIAQVVRDAMQLVQVLGERCLWVDSLGTVQDDAEMKQRALDI